MDFMRKGWDGMDWIPTVKCYTSAITYTTNINNLLLYSI
jgi:hypothetical protein